MKKQGFVLLFAIAFLLCFSSFSFKTNNKNKGSKSEESDDFPVAVFLSDFHIGEKMGAVCKHPQDFIKPDVYIPYINDNSDTLFYYHLKVKEFMEKIYAITNKDNTKKEIPYLVLNGDIFDLAVNNAGATFNLANDFFNATIFNDSIFSSYFENIIYIPGNHDHHVWQMFQEEYYITERLKSKKQALPLPQQYIGILDITADKDPSFIIHNKNQIQYEEKNNLFSYIISNNKKPVYVVYPNLYIKYNSDSSAICVTHGQFFEPGWNIMTNALKDILKLNEDSMYLANLERYNAPATEFLDYSLAQMDNELVQGINDFQYEDSPGIQDSIAKHNIETLRNLFPAVFNVKLKPKNTADQDMKRLLKYPVLVDKYLWNSQLQMNRYNLKFSKLIYGHTHIPCNDYHYIKYYKTSDTTLLDLNFNMYNTGGWVDIDPVKFTEPNPLYLYRNGNIKEVFANE